MIKVNPQPNNQNGLTLVEVLVAMVLGTFLIGSVLEVYLGSRHTNVMQDNLSELQENGRAAMDILSKDIRMAGFHGNSGFRTLAVSFVNPLPITPSVDTLISGVDSGQPNYWTAAQQAAVVPETDVITVLHAQPCGGKLQPPGMLNRSSNIPISATAANDCNINVNDVLFISNGVNADIFRATNSGSTAVSHARFSTFYAIDSELFNYVMNSYYIGLGVSNRPSLFRYDNTRATADELIEGIENMQLTYGIDTDAVGGTPNYYVTADGIGLNAQNIVSVHISLLVSSSAEVAQQPVAYSFNNQSIMPNDRRLRKVFSTTISLRNRLN